MFEAAQRQNLLDLLRPPPGYRLEAAVGTTYSLDFVALTAVLLALVDAESEADRAARQLDSLHAITRLVDRVRVFVDRGHIIGPRQANRVTMLYDSIIQEVCLPEGCFHPKVWVAHYSPRARPGSSELRGLVRVICSSRNLTTSQCWEAFVAIEGLEGKTKVAGPPNAGLRDFLARLQALAPENAAVVAGLDDVLRRTVFELPRPFQQKLDFLWQWQSGPGLNRFLPDHARRGLVLSPFIRKSFLKDFCDRCEQVTVISTQRELDAIQDDEFMATLCGGKNRVYVVEAMPAEPAGPEETEGAAMDLHAKLLILEGPDGTRGFLGSANASPSAWQGRNCEAIMRFSPGVSIDHFCDRFVFAEETAPRGMRRSLRGWISEYRRQPWVEGDLDRAKGAVDQVCDIISRLTLVAAYAPDERRMRLALEATPSGFAEAIAGWSSIVDIRAGLLSQFHNDSALLPFADLLTNGLCFCGVSPADLTEFIVVQVTHRQLEFQRRFVLKASGDLSSWRLQRDALLLQELLTRDSLQAFLQAILFDAAIRQAPSTATSAKARGLPGTAFSVWTELSIEDVIRACTEDRSRIGEIERVLKAFEQTQWVDKEFRQFWTTFVSAEAEAREGVAHG